MKVGSFLCTAGLTYKFLVVFIGNHRESFCEVQCGGSVVCTAFQCSMKVGSFLCTAGLADKFLVIFIENHRESFCEVQCGGSVVLTFNAQ